MQQNISIHTLIVLALVTLSAYFLAYTTDKIVREKFDTNLSHAIPAMHNRPETALRSDRRKNTSLDKQTMSGAIAERPPERNIATIQINGTSSSIEVMNFSPMRTLDRQMVLASTRNINDILMQARVVPCLKQGKTTGLQISRISPGSIYEKIGLQTGDVIMRINSRNLENPAGFLKLYQDLKGKKNISVDLYRHGQQLTLNYDIR